MTGGPDTNRLGQLVGGKYRITRLLARGGMGLVYEAQHAVVRRRFAVKFLRRDLSERRDILGRFQREAEAAGALENENVIAAIDFGVSDDGAPYIVMEYLDGETVADLLERTGCQPVERAAELVAQACHGIAAAHAVGIVHRDLKPHNLFVARRDDGTDLLKILDFGVAKLRAIDDASSATRTGTVLGTAAYMSPEQARGEKEIDQRADVYALGVILYELVSLKRPHLGDSQNAILHHIATQPAVPLGAVQPDLPAGFVAIVEQALASDPAARPPSAEAVARALVPFARRQVWPARPDDPGPGRGTSSSGAVALEAAPLPRGGAGAAARARRIGVGLALGGAILVTALVVGLRSGPKALPVATAPPSVEPAPPAAPSSAPAALNQPPSTGAAAPAPPSTPAAASPASPTADAAPTPPRGAGSPTVTTAAVTGGRPSGPRRTSAGRPAERSPSAPPTPPPATPPRSADRGLLGPAFDSANPYR